MLPKSKRLTNFELTKIHKSAKDFITKKVFTNVGTFLLLDLKTKENKYAITMSSKIFKTAVSRNKARRIFYNYLRENSTKQNGIPSLILQAKKVFTKEELTLEFEKIK